MANKYLPLTSQDWLLHWVTITQLQLGSYLKKLNEAHSIRLIPTLVATLVASYNVYYYASQSRD